MAFSPELVERVRQTVDIVDVIGSYISLKRSGASYKALSPFNKEKTPSFYVNPQKQIFKCFSSGHGGDVFKFVMLYENIDFPTAVRRLAEKAGIPVEEERPGEHQKAAQKKRDLLSLHQNVSSYWRDILLHDPRAEVAREYMRHREIPLSWAQEFGLGFAPDAWDDTLNWGRKHSVAEELLLESGVLVRNEQGRIYDRFRGRLIFAIHDEQGQVIAFSARLLDPEAKAAKYVNSPETSLFVKSRILFGFHRAKRSILEADQAVICEGQIDVLRCHADGILNAVAPLGTAFTPDHARLIKRFTKRVLLCLDSDRAGQAAADRVTRVLLERGEGGGGLEGMLQSDLGIEVVRLPEGEDPDSIITRQGAAAFKERLAQPMAYEDYLIEKLFESDDASTPAGRRKIVESMAAFLALIPNQVFRTQILQKVAVRLQISEQILEAELRKSAKPQRMERREPSFREEEGGRHVIPAPARKIDCHPLMADLIQIVYARPDTIPEIQKELSPDWVRDLGGSELLFRIMDLFTEELWTGEDSLMAHVGEGEQNYLSGLDSKHLESLALEDLTAVVRKACRRLHLEWIRGGLIRIARQMGDPALDGGRKSELLAEQSRLYKLKNSLTAST